MEVWKIIFLSKWVICRFHVNLPGGGTNSFFRVKKKWPKEFPAALEVEAFEKAKEAFLQVPMPTPWKINMELTAITHLERKIIFQTSMIMFHVNLPGCNENCSCFFSIWKWKKHLRVLLDVCFSHWKFRWRVNSVKSSIFLGEAFWGKFWGFPHGCWIKYFFLHRKKMIKLETWGVKKTPFIGSSFVWNCPHQFYLYDIEYGIPGHKPP